MKKMKILSTLIITVMVLFSCSTSKELTKQKENLKGSWTLTEYDFVDDNKQHYGVKAFDGKNIKCFVDSKWNFIPNNNTGKYTLNNETSCNGSTTSIVWSLQKGDDDNTYLAFKQVADGIKSKKITYGYKMRLMESTENSFSAISEVPFAGKKFQVRYKFNKNN